MSEWIRWMQQLQAIAQTGLHFSTSPFDTERYERLLDIATEIASIHTGFPAVELLELHLLQRGYATPRVDVRAACFRDGKILLVRERTDEKWALPGGWADVGDRPAEAAEREVLEESGYQCRASRLIGVFDANRAGNRSLELYHAYKLVFLCELGDSSEFSTNSEILEIGFFARDEIPDLSLNRSWPELITECFQHLDDENRRSHFE